MCGSTFGVHTSLGLLWNGSSRTASPPRSYWSARRILGERVGLIPYARFKAYLCVYRLAFPVMLIAMVLIAMGWGRLTAMGRMAKARSPRGSGTVGHKHRFQEYKIVKFFDAVTDQELGYPSLTGSSDPPPI